MPISHLILGNGARLFTVGNAEVIIGSNADPSCSLSLVSQIDSTVTVQTSASDFDGEIIYCHIAWGDGYEADIAPNSSPVHVYGSLGTKTITLVVRDDHGAEASASLDVIIESAVPQGNTGGLYGRSPGVTINQEDPHWSPPHNVV